MESSRLHYFFAFFFIFLFQADNLQCVFADESLDMSSMEAEELEGLFQVMESIVDDPTWRSTHPHPCTDNPWPGIGCEASDPDNILHVTKFHIGLDYTPSCRNNAILSSSIFKLHFLKSLFIVNCFHYSNTTISPNLVKLFPSLEELVLKSNRALMGSIPPELSGLSKLRILSLSQNNLQGSIPSELGNLSTLKHLDLSFNHLGGFIPLELGGLRSLSILDLSLNNLEGSIPESIGDMFLVEKIDLSYNNLSGCIPPDLGKLQNLSFLALSQNRFTGPLPYAFKHLTNLEYFMAEGNPMNSTLPDFFGSFPKLSELSLSSTGIEGSIPESLCRLHSLSTLALDGNRLNGSIPWRIGDLRHLFQLNLSENLLSGEVRFSEDFIKRLGNKLDLRGNKDLCASKSLYQVFSAGRIRVCSSGGESSSIGSSDNGNRKGNINVPEEEDHGVYGSFSEMILAQGIQHVAWIICILLLQLQNVDGLEKIC